MPPIVTEPKHITISQSCLWGVSCYLIQIESTFHELRPQGVLVLVGVQLAVGVQEPLRESSKGLPQGKVVPV